MTNQEFLQSFATLQSEVKELKMLHQRVLLYLKKYEGNITRNPLLIEDRISIKETCRILNCSEVTLWKFRKNGTIPYTKHKRTIRFKKIDILNYLNHKR